VRLRIKYLRTVIYARYTSGALSASCVPDKAQPCKLRLYCHLVVELLPDPMEPKEVI
jgi:hypothetical protein